MDQVTPPRDSQKAHRVGPRCGGGNLGKSPSIGDPGGARRRPLLRYLDTGLDRRPAYTPYRKRARSRSASREAEGTGPAKPRQPAFRGKVPNPAGREPGWMCRASSEGDEVPAESQTRNRFLERLAGGPVIVGDGGMGALLSAAVPRLRSPEEANLRAPQAVVSLHASFINAGAELIETNTFGANRRKLAHHFLEDDLERINSAGVKLARDARELSGRDVFIAGSIGPIGEAATSRVRRELFAEQAAILDGRGADLFAVETFYDLDEVV